jgi:upstream activation factor subunit UAF30
VKEREERESRLSPFFQLIYEGETMVSDQEIAKGVESVLRQSDPNAVTSLNGVVQQLEAKLGFDLSDKTGFIRDQINLLLRSHPTQPQPQPQQQPLPVPQPQQLHPKDHFALRNHPQFPSGPHPQQFPPHFALQPHLPHRPVDLSFRQPQPFPAAAYPPPPQATKPAVFTPNPTPETTPKQRSGFLGFLFVQFQGSKIRVLYFCFA